MRLNPEFPDAVEPTELESWIIIGKVQVKSYRLTEMIFGK